VAGPQKVMKLLQQSNLEFLPVAARVHPALSPNYLLTWQSIYPVRSWFEKNNLEMYGVTPSSAMRAYFLAAANIFEPDRAAERLGWARTAVIAQAISSCFLSSNASVTESMMEGLNAELTSDGHNLTRFEHHFDFCFGNSELGNPGDM